VKSLASFALGAAALALACATSPPAAPAAPVVSSPSAAAPPEPAIVARVRETYAFEPHELTEAQQTEKSKGLDALWDSAKKEPARFIPALRAALSSDGMPPFFYYDGGQLLAKLSTAPADRAIILAALARVDMRDITPRAYVETVHALAREGFDTSEAAFKILEDPKFVAYVPEHDLELGYVDALKFMLLPSSSAAIPGAVVARYPKERAEDAKKALLAIAYYLPPEGDALVRRVAADVKEPPALRDYAREIVGVVDGEAAADPASLALHDDGPRTIPDVIAARRKSAGRISDEALGELEFETRVLRTWLGYRARQKKSGP
jgi:hypothetical protein